MINFPFDGYPLVAKPTPKQQSKTAICLLINYDLPKDKEAYFDRIKWCKKFGLNLNVISLVLLTDSQLIEEEI